jgi:hypothetical protein
MALKEVFWNQSKLNEKVVDGNQEKVADEINKRFIGDDVYFEFSPTDNYKVFKIDLHIDEDFRNRYCNCVGCIDKRKLPDEEEYDSLNRRHEKEIDDMWKFYDEYEDKDINTLIVRLGELGFAVRFRNMGVQYTDIVCNGDSPCIDVYYVLN